MIDHMTSTNNPKRGKAIKAIVLVPVKASIRHIMEETSAIIKTLWVSINFRRRRSNKQPTVNIPQKYATVFAPIVCVSKS